MRRRTLSFVAFLLVASIGLAAPAGAGLISAPMLSTYATTVTVPVTIDPGHPGTFSIGKVVGETKLLDSTLDKVLGTESFVPVIAPAPSSGLSAPSGEKFNCGVDQSAPGLTVYEPLYSEHTTNKYYMSWLMALYSQRAARIVAGQGATFQVEECTAGGADAKNGYRATKSGAAVAYKDTEACVVGLQLGQGSEPIDGLIEPLLPVTGASGDRHWVGRDRVGCISEHRNQGDWPRLDLPRSFLRERGKRVVAVGML